MSSPAPHSPEQLTSRVERLRLRTYAALNRGLRRRGLALAPVPPEPRFEPGFVEAYKVCRQYTMTSRERMHALWGAVQYVTGRSIAGDLVECGVWRGGSAMLAAMALKQAGDTTRRVWLYDTFAGMTEPSPADELGLLGEDPRTEWRAAERADHNAWCYSPLTEVQQNVRATGLDAERFRFVKGPVEETLPREAPEAIALLRLDTDWYESTRHELLHLYPRLCRGGVLIIDDYGHWAGARRAVDEYLAEIGEHLLLAPVDYTGRVAVRP